MNHKSISQDATTVCNPQPIRPVRQIYDEKRVNGQPVISIELFPPKTKKSEESLFERALPRLASASPDFFSVTYGAGGSAREKTIDVVDYVQRRHGITGMAHITSISSTREEITQYLENAKRVGIRNILALRGDPPMGQSEFSRPDNGFDYSYQLIDFIKSQGDFSIGAAGFPECHIACTEGRHVDWQRVKNKIDHGAGFILTQLFYNNANYFEFLEYLVGKLGVSAPVTPGVLPIVSTKQVKRVTSICNAALPADLLARLDAFGDDDYSVREFGIDFATRQCEELLRGGAPGLHLYSLNRSSSCLAILENLGLART